MMDELGKFKQDVDFVKEAIQKISELKCPEHDVKLDIHVFNLGAGLIQLRCPRCGKVLEMRRSWLSGGWNSKWINPEEAEKTEKFDTVDDWLKYVVMFVLGLAVGWMLM